MARSDCFFPRRRKRKLNREKGFRFCVCDEASIGSDAMEGKTENDFCLCMQVAKE